MTPDWIVYVCLFLAIWSAVIGGVFSAFSEFVMAGLLRTAPKGGIEAMQHINRTVLKTQFVAGLLLIAPLSVLLGIYGTTSLSGASRGALILAPLIYLPTVFLMTVFGNVPMNKRLERYACGTADAQEYWKIYGRDWTRLNHVRTIGCLITSLLYVIAAVDLIGSIQS